MALVAGLSTISTFLSALRHTVFASLNFNSKAIEYVLSWNWRAWLALWSVVWICVILKGTLAAVRRREAQIAAADRHRIGLEENAKQISRSLDSERQKTRQLEAELSEVRRLRDMLQVENRELKARQDKTVSLSLSLRTEDKPRVFMTGKGQNSFGDPDRVAVSVVTLLIYNHGERPVPLRGCKIWKLHATEATQELRIHGVVTSTTPLLVDITKPLLDALSGGGPFDFTSLQGEYTLRLAVADSEGSGEIEAEPHDFQLTCTPWWGGQGLRIEAQESRSEQS